MGDKAYKIIKRFFSEHKNRSRFLKSSDEKVITVISDEEEKLRTWKEYIKMYGNEQADTIRLSMTKQEDMKCNTGQPILREEFEIALKELKSNKVPRIDELNRKLLKALDGYGKNILFRIIGKAYENGIILKNFKKCIIIPIPKKNKSEIVKNTGKLAS